jgi:hypothetical protein
MYYELQLYEAPFLGGGSTNINKYGDTTDIISFPQRLRLVRISGLRRFDKPTSMSGEDVILVGIRIPFLNVPA